MSQVEFKGNTGQPIQANEGFIRLVWEGTSPVNLEVSPTQDFSQSKSLYSGSDSSYFMTGLTGGTHYFRLQGGGETSALLQVSVNYPSKALVVGSLSVGSVLFFSLCLIILLGNRKYAKSSAEC